MAILRNLVVKITGDTSGLQKSLSGAQKSVNSAATAIGGTMSSMAAGGAMVAAAFTAITAAVISTARKTMPMYAESLAAETKLRTVMQQRMGASEGLVQSMLDLANAEQQTGVTEGDAITAGQQQLATFLHNADALRKLTPALADLVAQQQGYESTSEGATSVANLMGKAMDGNVGALRKVGISFTDAQAKVLKTGNEMERAAMLAQVIADNVGNMNQALGNTTVGRVLQLSNAWGDVQEKVGNVFYSLLAAATPALMTLINAISTALDWVNALVSALTGVNTTVSGVSTGASDAAGGMDDLASSTSAAGAAAKKSLAGFDQLNKLSDSSGGGGGGGGGANLPEPSSGGNAGGSLFGNIDTSKLQEIVQWFNDTKDAIYTYLKPGLEYIQQVFGKIADILGGSMDGESTLSWFLTHFVVNGIETIINGWVTAFGDLVTVFAGVIEMIKGLFTLDPVTFFNGLKDTMLGLFSLPIDNLANIIDMIGRLFGFDIGASAFVQGIKSKILEFSFATAWEGIKNAWSAVTTWFTGVWDGIKGVFVGVGDWFGQVFKVAVELITYWFAPAVDFFRGLWNNITSVFQPVADFFQGVWSGAFNLIKSNFASTAVFFSNLWTTIKSPFLGVAAFFQSVWSGAFNLIKSNFAATGSFFSGVWNAVKAPFVNVANWFKSAFSSAWTAVKNVFAPVGTFFGNIWNTIKAKFTQVGTSIGSAVGTSFKSVVNSIFATIERIVNNFINFINGALDIIDRIPGVNLGRISKVTLPRLAEGGIATSSTIAQIGERGREAVLPLENNTSWMDTLAGKLALAGGPGGDTYVYLDGQQIAARIEHRRSWESIKGNGRR